MAAEASIDHVSSKTVPDLVPARMVNEYVYCARLAYLEWVQGEFEHSVDTLEGRFEHRRVNQAKGRVPQPEEPLEKLCAVRAALGAPTGTRGGDRSDGATPEASGALAAIMPVDYKKGSAPDLPDGAWEPDRVQVAVQALILRENGYTVDRGVLYYCASKTRVEVSIDGELERKAHEAVDGLREIAQSGVIPPPLVDSPKCPKCSLVGICLPDETRYLATVRAKSAKAASTAAGGGDDAGSAADPERGVRPLLAARDDGHSLYVQTQGAYISKKGEVIEVFSPGRKELLAEVRLNEITQVSLFGNVQVTTQALQAFCDAEVPVPVFLVWGMVQGDNPRTSVKEHRAADGPVPDGRRPAALPGSGAALRRGQDRESRTLVRRNHPAVEGSVLEPPPGCRQSPIGRRSRIPAGDRGLSSTPVLLPAPGAPATARDGRRATRYPPRLRGQKPPTSERPGQCSPLLRVFHARERPDRYLLEHRPRSFPRVFPPAPVRPSRAGARPGWRSSAR